jgi:hypothetical protein
MQVVRLLRDNGTNTVFVILAFGAVLIAGGFAVRDGSPVAAIALWALGSFLMLFSIVGLGLILFHRETTPEHVTPNQAARGVVAISGHSNVQFRNCQVISQIAPPVLPQVVADFLSQDVIEDRIFFIYDVPRAEPMIIRNKTFRRCQIHGPALITFLGKTKVSGLNWGASPDQMLWEVPPERFIGVIGLLDCTIEGGQMYAIGVTGSAPLMEIIRRSGLPPSQDGLLPKVSTVHNDSPAGSSRTV